MQRARFLQLAAIIQGTYKGTYKGTYGSDITPKSIDKNTPAK